MAQTAPAKGVFHLGTGRRKTAVARVRLTVGSGKIEVNGRPLDDYFTEEKDRAAVLGPLLLAEMRSRLDVIITTHGGGITGQAGAACQGIARALKKMFGLDVASAPPQVTLNPDGSPGLEEEGEGSFDKRLRESGFLTRDSRMKERKKYGKKGARKSFQFSKR